MQLPGAADGAEVERLRPRHGARYSFELGEDGSYAVLAVPAERHGPAQAGRLHWDEAGKAELSTEMEPSWLQAEVLKLARPLKRERPARMVRWRPAPESA